MKAIIIENEYEVDERIQAFLKDNASSIPLCCNGIYKQAFGYKWKYE